MGRPLLLIHGYSATGLDFTVLRTKLRGLGVAATDLNVGNYISLNNEITVKDIAEGLERAIELTPELSAAEEFDAIVHSTGMLVVRAWLTHQAATADNNLRLRRLKHLVGVAPATWGSPQAAKGRSWLGALVKGDKTPGPDFLNAGDEVLDALELGGKFTWDLAHQDLLGDAPYFGTGPDTPYVAVFIGNTPYSGISSVANDPGTDGTVRWAGCGLNTRKIVMDLTHSPVGADGKPRERITMTPWAAEKRLNIPMIPVDGRTHASIISDPDDGMVTRIVTFLQVSDQGGFDAWMQDALEYGKPAMAKMLVSPGNDASGIPAELMATFGHLLGRVSQPLEGWQQFVVRARDGRGDPVSDYLVEVCSQVDGKWQKFDQMYTDVHAYKADQSYRCFHIQLPPGVCNGTVPIQIHLNASTGTDVMAYQGYGTDENATELRADSAPVAIDIPADLGDGGLFHPFTTTLIEIVLNRAPYPFDKFSQIFTFLPRDVDSPAAAGPVSGAREPTP